MNAFDRATRKFRRTGLGLLLLIAVGMLFVFPGQTISIIGGMAIIVVLYALTA